MGRFITLPGVNPPADRAKVDIIDPILPEAGALLLVEPAHPYESWAAGVPADEAKIPNLALDQALTLLGSSTDAHAQLAMDIGSTIVDETRGAIERTGKGGLHTIFDDALAGTTTANNNAWTRLAPSSQLLAYLQAHGTDDYFVSQWYDDTRILLTTGGIYDDTAHIYGAVGGATANRLFWLTGAPGAGNTNGPVSAPSRRNPAYPALGPKISNVGTVTRDGTSTLNDGGFFLVGNYSTINGYSSGAFYNRHASRAYYRLYMENLTESARTYAEVDAIDYAMWQDAFGVGGRYADDTYTDPATWEPA